MNIQENLRAKKARDEKVSSGELTKIDVQNLSGSHLRYEFLTTSETPLRVLEGYAVQRGGAEWILDANRHTFKNA